jgi:hypothetical protein
MNHDQICSWLGLPPGGWPPDHYRLLGLAPGEDNTDLIEQRVHERLDAVRRYQITHPEQATEAMNRLAQAFVCLTEKGAKREYDAMLLGTPLADPAAETAASAVPSAVALAEPPELPPWLPRPTTAASVPTPPPLPGPLARLAPLATPPPLPASLLPPAAAEAPAPAPAPAAPAPAPQAVPAEPVDPILEAARSPAARRGLGTKRALYYRVSRTRNLVRAWSDLGTYLASPKRRLRRSTEATELIARLNEVSTLLRGFPPLLGEAGQPGYLVLALTQLADVPSFQHFSPHQREALSRDWRSALKLLTAHRDFLRQELRAMRRRTLLQRLTRATRALVADQPGVVLLLLALVALNVALWRTYAEDFFVRFFSR